MPKVDTNHCDRARASTVRLKKRAWSTLGKRCCFCRGRAEHMAHVLPTKLHGAGRSNHKRYRDVLRHPECYRAMCVVCHRLFDKLTHDLMQAAKGAREEPIPF